MKGPEKERRAEELEAQLVEFHKEQMPLVGVAPVENRLAFVAQLIDSIQRVEYVHTIAQRNLSPARADAASRMFDPIRAAVLKKGADIEEACWLVFLATHCGRHLRTEWLLARELYGAYEQNDWSWDRVSADTDAYGEWLAENHGILRGKFGNHRKYESLKPGPSGTGTVVSSYAEWIQEYGSHAQMFSQAFAAADGNRRRAFGLLYDQMRAVRRFGRTGRFDYLTMLAKVGLAGIEADSTYLHEATGPLKGARLLFDGQIDSKTGPRVLEAKVAALDRHLNVGMQVLEDSICNWQKSPNAYQPFRG